MERKEIPGGWYGEARIDRQYAVLVAKGEPDADGIEFSHIDTSGRRVELPPGAGGMVGLRVTPRGPFLMAGQSHHGLGNYQRTGAAWDRVGDSYGVNPVIYDDGGTLFQGAPRFGSQGFRFFREGVLYTGDQTVNDRTPQAQALHVSQLWEWTQLGDVTIGQGEHGCIAVYRGVRYVLEPGGCYFIHLTREGDALAIAIVKLQENKTVLLWLSALEILDFPRESAPVPAPTPAPPVPQPTPEPPPMSLRTVLMPNRIKAIVQAFYDRFLALAEGDDDQRRQLQTMICKQTRFELGPEWGAKRADSGRPRSKDSIAFFSGGVLYSADCFNGGTRKPSVPNVLEEIPGQVFDPVEPENLLGVGGAPAPVPSPAPTPAPAPAPDCAAERAENVSLKRALEQALVLSQAHPSYDGMMQTIRDSQKAYGRRILPPETTAHLMWRFLLENYTADQIVADARERGKG